MTTNHALPGASLPVSVHAVARRMLLTRTQARAVLDDALAGCTFDRDVLGVRVTLLGARDGLPVRWTPAPAVCVDCGSEDHPRCVCHCGHPDCGAC
jgi:hypothetical protein